MSQQNKTQLQSTINTNIADNTVGDITAADVRNSLINATDSLLFNSGSQTFNGTLTISDSLDITNFITASKISINDGGDSVFVGEGAGLNDDGTINQNVGIGVDALLNNTTGWNNTATGKNSLSSNIAGHNNTANGAYSLSANTNGTYNTATGISSLMATTTGNGNTANGAYSLQTNETGFYNTAVGYISLFSNVNGVNNTATGYYSLEDNTTGNYNTAIGGRSLSKNTTGDYTVAFGYDSGRFITGGSTANAIANNSVYLGSLTKAKANNETNQIVIGYNTTGNGSNTVTIGNSSITNNYFNGDVSATSFTGNGATISGSLIASGSVVDFTNATAISGSTFSGSFVGTIGTNPFSTTTMNGILITEEYTVSSLPASPATGSRAHVTDSTLTTFYSPVTGSGANPVPVFYNGTQWVIA